MSSEPQTLFGGADAGTDGLANMQNNLLTLTFEHVFSDFGVRFKAFLKDFSDNYECKWNSEEVFGRNDPLQMFQGTSRKITVSWSVPAFNKEDGMRNLAKAGKLIHMLYPAYEGDATKGGFAQNNIAAGPVLKVRFGNLICSAGQGGAGVGPLYGTISSLTVKPDIELGFFFSVKDKGPPESSGDYIIPKAFDVSCEIQVLHIHPLGWHIVDGTAKPRDAVYAYGPDADGDKSAFPYKAEHGWASEPELGPHKPFGKGETPADGEGENESNADSGTPAPRPGSDTADPAGLDPVTGGPRLGEDLPRPPTAAGDGGANPTGTSERRDAAKTGSTLRGRVH